MKTPNPTKTSEIIENKGFTLTELLITVIIIGLVAAFAVPNYTRTIERSRFRDARAKVIAIHAALEMEEVKTQAYGDGSTITGLDNINTKLGLNLTDPDGNFTFSYIAAGTFDITADRNGLDYDITANQNPISAANPTCSGTDCPS